jgi:chromosomal replication initiator protein
MGATPRRLETELRTAVAGRVGAERFGLWFGEGVRLAVGDDGEALLVDVPNGFFREWIGAHYAGDLAAAGESVTGRRLRVDVRVGSNLTDEAEPPLGDVVVTPARETPGGGESIPRRVGPTVPIPGVSPPPGTQPPPSTPPRVSSRRGSRGAMTASSMPLLDQAPAVSPAPSSSSLTVAGRPGRRLDDFVTGPGSRLAHAAALEFVETAGAAFNPLVLHAATGLGKTHLLDGIAAALRVRRPGSNVVQTTAEGFTNAFLESMRNGSMAAFRNRFRRADALVVDDVHFLAAKRATQDEFLHTFNALTAAGSPIVVAADEHPRRLSRLTEELVTRFLGGMVVRLEAPDPATRRAILGAKAEARRVDVPAAVIEFIAEHLRSSVRELEGALHTVIAHALLTGRRIDLALARTALRDTIRHTAQAVALRDVERAVCELYGVDAEALRSDGRARKLTQPRMIAMYLARKHAGSSYSEIGRHFGGRNHSTVISAEKKVASWLADEQQCGLLAGFESVADVLSTLERTLQAV